MDKKPVLNDNEVQEVLDTPDSPPLQNSPFGSPNINEGTQKIEQDPLLTDDEDDSIFTPRNVNVSSNYVKPANKSALQSAFDKSPAGRGGERSNNISTSARSFKDEAPHQSSFFSGSYSRSSLNPSIGHDPLDMFKCKSKVKSVQFVYETSDESTSSFLRINENLPPDEAVIDVMKQFDKWVSRYVKLTKDVPDSKKLPLVDTSFLTKLVETKISGQRKQLRGNSRTQTTNGRKTKPLNFIDEDNGSSSPNEGGWKSRYKDKFEHKKPSHSNQKPTRMEEGEACPYKYTDDKPDDFQALNANKGIRKTEAGQRNFSKPKREANVEVEFAFEGKIMEEEPELKPDQRLFSSLLKNDKGSGSRTDSPRQDNKPTPSQNNENPKKQRDSFESSEAVHRNGRGRQVPGESSKASASARGRGRGHVMGRQDILNGAHNRNSPDSSSMNSPENQNNHQISDDSEDGMPCPICNKTFRMGAELVRHANDCLIQSQSEPVKTRSNNQANASGKKRPLHLIEPASLILCPYCDNHVERTSYREHIKECEEENHKTDRSSDEDSSPSTKVQKRS